MLHGSKLLHDCSQAGGQAGVHRVLGVLHDVVAVVVVETAEVFQIVVSELLYPSGVVQFVELQRLWKDCSCQWLTTDSELKQIVVRQNC